MAGVLLIAVSAQATTVLAVRNATRVVIGADSRFRVVGAGSKGPQSGCKIHATRGVVWSQVGYYANRETGFDVVAIGRRAFSADGTFDTRLQRVATTLTEPLHRALLALRKANPKEYDDDIGTPLKIIAAGIDGQSPVLGVLQFGRGDSGLIEVRKYRCPGDCPGGTQYVSAGVHEEADRIVNSGPDAYFSQRGWSGGLRGLLEVEAAGHPDQVGAPFTIVEVNGGGVQWIERGACTD